MVTQRDYYEVLSVSRDATDDVIKRSYRKLAMKYHPDRNGGDEKAETRFKECAAAYEVLSDPQKRQRYDQFGHEGLRGTSGHDFSQMNAGDIFSMFEDIFGSAMGGRGGRSRRGQRGYDLETTIEVSLEEAASGVEREIDFTRMDHCSKCSGSGAKPGTEPLACVTCGGTGQVAQAGFGGMFRMVTACPACRGQGKVVKDKCPGCKGTGQTPKKRTLSVKIPAGVQSGQYIRIPGEGEPGSNGAPRGNLHVVVDVASHKLFQREDDHLILRMPISFSQAALGAEVEVPTLGGSDKITIHPGTQHGHLIRLRGKGMPNLRSGQPGDLVVALTIEIPQKLSARQRELLHEFAETENHDVMPESRGFWDRIKEYIGP